MAFEDATGEQDTELDVLASQASVIAILDVDLSWEAESAVYAYMHAVHALTNVIS